MLTERSHRKSRLTGNVWRQMTWARNRARSGAACKHRVPGSFEKLQRFICPRAEDRTKSKQGAEDSNATTSALPSIISTALPMAAKS
jgi:hypothetical protein